MTVGDTSLSVIYGSKLPPRPITRQYIMKSMNNSVFNQFIRMWLNRINFWSKDQLTKKKDSES